MKIQMQFIIMSVIFLALDFTYIFLVKDYFFQQIINIQRVSIKFRPIGAIICYIILLFALNWFIISRKKSSLDAALLGAVIYGVYDSTNYATLKKWDAKFAIIDVIWGATLFWATTELTYKLFS